MRRSSFLLLLLPVAAEPATLRVPSEYATINAGLDAAASGDTVLVAPGTYTDYEVRGNRTACAFLKGGVVLRSEAGPLVTTIDMQGQGTLQPHVIVGWFLSEEVRVEGFTVTGVPFLAGVSFHESAKATMRDCILRDMDSGGVGTAGAISASDTDLDVIGCEFVNCHGPLGGGIYQSHAALEVSDSSFRECGSGAIWLSQSTGSPGSAFIHDCSFVENVGNNGAIVSSGYAGVAIERCYFEGNVAEGSGGAAAVISGGLAMKSVRECVFLTNRVAALGASGGALRLGGAGSFGIVEHNTFYGNSLSSDAGGASISFQSGNWTLANNVIAGSAGSAAVLDLNANLISSCNVFWANEDGNGAGYELGPTDQEVDPEFCDAENSDLTVSVTSPCLPENSMGCGLIGAFGQGCGTVSIERTSWGRIKSKYLLRGVAEPE